MSTATQPSTFDAKCGIAIVDVLRSMIDEGEMDWTRSQILNSDEAARTIIARLPGEFRSIDTNHFRRLADSLEKRSANKGGFPHFHPDREHATLEDSLMKRLQSWNDDRSHFHSPEYEALMVSPEYAEQKRRWKERFGYQCVACGSVRLSHLLEIHHYTYDRLGRERDEDVCCVCSPSTGFPCHALLDLAREFETGNIPQGLFS